MFILYNIFIKKIFCFRSILNISEKEKIEEYIGCIILKNYLPNFFLLQLKKNIISLGKSCIVWRETK